MKELKKTYHTDFTTIRTIVNEFDLCDLVHLGAPVDEYDVLTNTILKIKYANQSVLESRDEIFSLLIKHYGVQSITPDFETQLQRFLEVIDSVVLEHKQ